MWVGPIFFLNCTGSAGDLHSFPTRRSSDLHRPGARLDGLVRRRHPPVGRGAARASRRALARQDRKSTRLNSSHVEISYAVFCLKKKNQIQCTSKTYVTQADTTDLCVSHLVF